MGLGVLEMYLNRGTGIGGALGQAERAADTAYLFGKTQAKFPIWTAETGTSGYNRGYGVAGANSGASGRTISATIGRNEVRWLLTDEGFNVEASGVLREYFPGAKRSAAEVAAQREAASRGIAGDQGGHNVGHRFVLGQGEKNLFPQNGNFNNSAFKTLENDYARWIDQGHEVRFTHRLQGLDASGRPSYLRAEYEVLDQSGNVVSSFSKRFANQSGQTYTRRAY